MPLDTRQARNKKKDQVSIDSKRKLVLKTAVTIVQSLDYTFGMLTAWNNYPNDIQYPGYAEWNQEWSHEQRAVSEYIRYDYNSSGTNIIELPCSGAIRYPGLFKAEHITSSCTGGYNRYKRERKRKGNR